MTAAVEAADADLEAAVARHDQLARTVAALRPAVADRLVGLYKLGGLGYTRLMLEANDLR